MENGHSCLKLDASEKKIRKYISDQRKSYLMTHKYYIELNWNERCQKLISVMNENAFNCVQCICVWYWFTSKCVFFIVSIGAFLSEIPKYEKKKKMNAKRPKNRIIVTKCACIVYKVHGGNLYIERECYYLVSIVLLFTIVGCQCLFYCVQQFDIRSSLLVFRF